MLYWRYIVHKAIPGRLLGESLLRNGGKRLITSSLIVQIRRQVVQFNIGNNGVAILYVYKGQMNFFSSIQVANILPFFAFSCC